MVVVSIHLQRIGDTNLHTDTIIMNGRFEIVKVVRFGFPRTDHEERWITSHIVWPRSRVPYIAEQVRKSVIVSPASREGDTYFVLPT